MSETNKPSGSKVIRPAASLLIVRDGEDGVEVLVMKRSHEMRFLPGYLAYPGGSLDSRDWMENASWWTGSIIGQNRHDDPAYAIGAVRECAEEVGWLCALQSDSGIYALSEQEQRGLLTGECTLDHLLAAHGFKLDGSSIRFVGRWVTPPHMPARFDTRFFLYVMRVESPEPRLHSTENEWVRWCRPVDLLSSIQMGAHNAVPPTIAMLKGIAEYSSADDCLQSLSVPGPKSGI